MQNQYLKNTRKAGEKQTEREIEIKIMVAVSVLCSSID